ncbi:MAG TPA: S9 family peptidase, partial [Idiomarina sp.]|nr:S9 family peptidase [Idiomarina sp.]
NGKIFYLRNDGLQSQASLYMQTDLDSPPINVVDATQLDSSGLKAITRFSVSPNANYLAYAVSEVGSDWSAWYIKDLRSGEVLDEVITGTKFTNISWYPDR